MSDAALEREMSAQWAALGLPAGAADVLDELRRRHGEPHRRYHTFVHVARVLREVRRLLPLVPVPDPVTDPVPDPVTVALAAWFHDAVYDPRAAAGANEAASAALAADRLGGLAVPPARIAEVTRLIGLTAGHTPAAGDTAGAVLVDADLAVLAGDPAAYQAYAHGVRAEYAHVDDDGWRTGRAAVLRHFLDQASLFHVAAGDDREPRARANIAAELASLGSPPPARFVTRE